MYTCTKRYSFYKFTIHLPFICQGIARTQSPTTKNYTPEFPTFGGIADFSQAMCTALASTWTACLRDHKQPAPGKLISDSQLVWYEESYRTTLVVLVMTRVNGNSEHNDMWFTHAYTLLWCDIKHNTQYSYSTSTNPPDTAVEQDISTACHHGNTLYTCRDIPISPVIVQY